MFESEKVYGLHKELFHPKDRRSQMFISFQDKQTEILLKASALFFERFGITSHGNMIAVLSAIFIEEMEKKKK